MSVSRAPHATSHELAQIISSDVGLMIVPSLAGACMPVMVHVVSARSAEKLILVLFVGVGVRRILALAASTALLLLAILLVAVSLALI